MRVDGQGRRSHDTRQKCSYRRRSMATPWYLVGFLATFAALTCASRPDGSVGAVFGKGNTDGRVFVREVPPDMVAAKAGLQVGDEVVSVNGAAVQKMSPDDVHRALAGEIGTKVRLTVVRRGEQLELVIERGPLRQPRPTDGG